MKTIFWVLLCGTVCTYTMQRLSDTEVHILQETKKELIQRIEKLNARLERENNDCTALDEWEAAQQQLRDITKLLSAQ